jgi:branched-chain amino acid transport system ATP-binding protein
MEMLKVEDLSKSFGGLKVLQEISFTVGPGEKLAIIGPNGAGKTTLFNVIGGQLPFSAGHAYLSGKEITRLPPHRRLHLGLARSFQINNLFVNLSLMDNLILAIKGSRHPHFQLFQSVNSCTDLFVTAKEVLKSVGLWELRSVPVRTLSYGDQRLVEVAFALTSKPKLVLLDEPTAGLSTADAAEFGNNIRRLLGDTSLVFCAHDMDLVFNLADRIMVLYYGKIIAQGNPEEIQVNPKVREIYLGSEETEENAGNC